MNDLMRVVLRSSSHRNVGSHAVTDHHSKEERGGDKRDEFRERGHGYALQYREP